MTYTKKVEQYMYTESVYYEDGVEVERVRNYDDHWFDTRSEEEMTAEEWEEEVG